MRTNNASVNTISQLPSTKGLCCESLSLSYSECSDRSWDPMSRLNITTVFADIEISFIKMRG